MDFCFTRCKLRFARGVLFGHASFPSLKMHACRIHVRLIISLRKGHEFQHDAIDGAGGNASFAAGAIVGNHRVHPFVCTDDGVDRAHLNAFSASNAIGLDDARQRARFLDAVFGIQRNRCAAEQCGKFRYARTATRRTLIDVGVTLSNGFCVRAATVITALFALRLR